MSYRRKLDEWDAFLKRHGPELLACGVPDTIVHDRKRFLRFVDNGYDEDASLCHHAPFSPDLMTPEQAAQLATLIREHVGDEAGSELVRALRRRAGLTR
jgi:hypothetical protein